MSRIIFVSFLTFLSLPVFAQNAPAQSANSSMFLVFMILAFGAMMYFTSIRPNQKRNREHQALLAALKKGDEIMIASGMVGRVNAIGENFIVIEIAQNVEVRVQRNSIASLMPKGSYKGDLG